MKTELDKVKARIAALLAKAESTEFEGEALSYMAKVQELLAEYQLTIYDLRSPDTIDMTPGLQSQPGPGAYKSDVQIALAKYFGARPISNFDGSGHRGQGWRVEIVGPESARITTILMTEFVWAQVHASARRIAEKGLCKKDKAVREVAKALVARINGLIRERKLQGAPSVATGSPFALVTVDAVNAKVLSLYSNLHSIKSKGKSLLQSAVDEAKGISLHHQTGGRQQHRLQ